MTVTYFNITTAHGSELAVILPDDQLVSCSRSASSASRQSVIGFTVASMPEAIFLIPRSSDPSRLRLSKTAIRGRIIALKQHRMPNSDQIALQDPMTHKYVCACKLAQNSGTGALEGNRVNIAAWEFFTLTEIDRTSLELGLYAIAEAVERLFSTPISAETFKQVLPDLDPAASGPAIDALLPYLSLQVLREFGEALLADSDLYQKLAPHFANDIWWKHAVPPLVERLGKHPPEGTRYHWEQPKRVEVGAQFDQLSAAGLDGAYVSVPHACSSQLRTMVQPSRNICMLTAARNEGIYLLEWIAFHRSIGVEWFYIYSNNNDDGSDLLLEALADAGIITWIDNKITGGISAQRKAFGHALSVLPEILDFAWCMALDLDEFVILNPDRFRTFSEFIAWQEMRQVDAIAMNWRFMASVEDQDVVGKPLICRNTRFAARGAVGEGWRLVKSLFRPQAMLHSKAHTPIASERTPFVYRLSNGDIHRWTSPPPGLPMDPGFSDVVTTDNVCIYHYFYKSAEEWFWKSSRNRGGQPVAAGHFSQPLADDWVGNFIGQHNSEPEGEDDRLKAFMRGFDEELAMLRSNPTIATAAEMIKDGYKERLQQIKESARTSDAGRLLTERTRPFLSLVGI